MELFKSLETKTKNFNDPFQHFEINEPLTQEAIDEISNAKICLLYTSPSPRDDR